MLLDCTQGNIQLPWIILTDDPVMGGCALWLDAQQQRDSTARQVSAAWGLLAIRDFSSLIYRPVFYHQLSHSSLLLIWTTGQFLAVAQSGGHMDKMTKTTVMREKGRTGPWLIFMVQINGQILCASLREDSKSLRPNITAALADPL